MVQTHLAVHIAHLGPEITPMHINQHLAGDLAQPHEKGNRWPVQKISQSPRRFHARILQNVFHVNFAHDAGIEAKHHHAGQISVGNARTAAPSPAFPCGAIGLVPAMLQMRRSSPFPCSSLDEIGLDRTGHDASVGKSYTRGRTCRLPETPTSVGRPAHGVANRQDFVRRESDQREDGLRRAALHPDKRWVFSRQIPCVWSLEAFRPRGCATLVKLASRNPRADLWLPLRRACLPSFAPGATLQTSQAETG